MKKILAGLVVASVMTACSNSANDAEIQQAKQYTIDSMKQVTAQKEADARAAEASAAATKRSTTSKTTSTKSYASPGTTTTSTRDDHDRKGWSNKAKGAVIGGVVGAATGAAVSDKKGKGAIIGGVVGAAGGYGVGAILDKKKKKQ